METGEPRDARAAPSDAGARPEVDAAAERPADSAAPPLDPASCHGDGGALATCLTPHQTPDYYVSEALKYFDTLDSNASITSVPRYSELVARWEWAPWLKLTGYGRQTMTNVDLLLRVADPSTVPVRDCRAFPTQPFARCRISFKYTGGMCPIYEEFVFNDEGETTFIEAWSDLAGLLPMADPADRWGEGANVHRLSTKLPGLGDAHGLIQLDAPWMQAAGARDPEISDFVHRAKNFWTTWYAEYNGAGSDLFKRGCGW